MLYRRSLPAFVFSSLIFCSSSVSARQSVTPASAPASQAWPEAFAPMRVRLGATGYVDVGLRVQLQSDTRWGHWADSLESSVRFRRVRPALKGRLLDSRLAFKLQINTVPGDLELIDLWASYRVHPWFCLQLGQQKIAYTRYRTRSDGALPLVDWPLATRYFGAERQIGLLLQSTPLARSRFAYLFGLSTGVNARASHQVALAEAYGEASDSPSSLGGPSLTMRWHPELSVRLSAVLGHRGELPPWRLRVELSGAYDVRPERAFELAARSALELIFTARRFELWATGHIGFFEDREQALDLGLGGVVGELSYQLHRHLSIGARFTRVFLSDALRRDIVDWDASRPAGSVLSASGVLVERLGGVMAEQELGISLNVHFVGHHLKWQTELRWLRWSVGANGALDDFQLRSQLQLVI